MIWYSYLFQNFPQFLVIHTVKGFGIVNKAEIDVFLELSCFFDDPVDVGNLISGSSAFSKTSLNIWKFMVHVLLKPGLQNFEHYLLVCEMSAIVQEFEHSLALPFFGMASLVAQRLKHLPAMREMWVQSLGWEDPLEKEMATHSSTLAWRIPWMEEPVVL